jgi:PST family polysaccharide transporter
MGRSLAGSDATPTEFAQLREPDAATVTDSPIEAPDIEAPWGRGSARRFVTLAGARAVAQILGLAWFLIAARWLSDEDFGTVASGLAIAALAMAVADLGVTRTVVRHVAADPATLWSVYWRALRVRVVAGLAVAVVGAGVVAVLPVTLEPGLVLIAGGIGVASGAAELAYAGLRATGRIRAETFLLISERAIFLTLGLVVLQRGGGPIAVLLLYLATNLLSAIGSGEWLRESRPAIERSPARLKDREAKVTALGSSLALLGPRVAPVLVALFASAAQVGVLTVAQKPLEAMSAFLVAAAQPLFPLVRSRIAGGEERSALQAAVAVAAILVVLMTPALLWFVVSPEMVVSALLGGDRYEGADVVLRVLALTAVTWSLRAVGEFVLLSQERARDFVVVASLGTVCVLVLGVPLTLASGALGAAVAIVAAELLMFVLLGRLVPALVDRGALVAYTPSLALALVAGALLYVSRESLIVSFAVVAVASCGALGIAVVFLRRMEAS